MLLQLFRVEHGGPREIFAMTITRVACCVGGLRHGGPRKYCLRFNKSHLDFQGSKACEPPEQIQCAKDCLSALNTEGDSYD
jgi:hypothetical protein